MSVILLYLIFSPGVQILASPILISVVQIFRHGQRTPVMHHPNDPYSDRSYWHVSPGQLTNVGKAQHYALGKYTRKRYIDVIPTAYSEKFIYVQSTDVDRTHMSAQCNLLGLFPPTKNELWNPAIAWSPIPVHPTSVITTFNACVAHDKEYVRVLANESYYRDIDEAYAETYKYLTKKTGSNITSFSETFTLFDALLIEREYGFPLPGWTKSVFPEPLTTLAGYLFQSFCFNTKMDRLSTGTFLNEVMEHFEAMKGNSSSAHFFWMYSAHDLNIAVVLSALGAFKPHVPSFASSIYFELWNSSGIYYVNIYYKNKDTLKKITPLGCPEFNCELGDLKKGLSDVLLDIATWNAECAN